MSIDKKRFIVLDWNHDHDSHKHGEFGIKAVVERSLRRYSRFTSIIRKIDWNEEACTASTIKFVFKNLMCDEDEQDEKCKGNCFDEYGSIGWYWKTSGSIYSWKKYDLQSQIQIENAYSDDKKSMVILDQGPIYSNMNNDKFYKKYAILFEDKCKQARLTRKPKMYHSISNVQWNQPFTKYFYQKHLIQKKYRIVKRVNYAKNQHYTQYISNMDENYF